MGYLQGRDQDNSLMWKARSNQNEGSHHSSALRRPDNSKPANPVLSLRRGVIEPPYDLAPAAGSKAMPVRGREASYASTLPDGTNYFGHIRSSMGKLSLQSGERTSRKMPLQVNQESNEREHVEEDTGTSESESHDTDSDFSPETYSPISIRSHIAAQLKVPEQERNGMRIRPSHESRPYKQSSVKDLRTVRKGNIGHYSPTISEEMEGNAAFPEHGNVSLSIRQRRERPIFGEPSKFRGRGLEMSHGYSSPSGRFVILRCLSSGDPSSAHVHDKGDKCLS